MVRGCFESRLKNQKAEKQLMGQLPLERLAPLAPFEATALDLFGPFPVKDPAMGRRTFKCWVVSYVCMASKSVCLLPCPGYDSEMFLTTHRFFVGVYR